MRPRILEARRVFERDVLFAPIMAALARGNDLQVAGILEAFDGSFFKGRFYARQPEAMIDVGNDREFGFLYHPERQVLESVFSRLFSSCSCRREPRKRSLQLAAFFKVLEQSEAPTSRRRCLQRLSDGDPGVREAARALVSSSLDPSGAEADPRPDRTPSVGARGLARRPRGRVASDRQEQPPGREPGNPGHDPQADRAPRGRPELASGPAAGRCLPTPKFVSLLEQAWPRMSQPQRLDAIEVLLGPPCSAGSVGAVGIRAQRAAPRRDGFVSGGARADACAASAACRRLWSARAATTLLLSALADDTPPCAGRASRSAPRGPASGAGPMPSSI